jgi:transcriptional regulator with XRE-family HTH domain
MLGIQTMEGVAMKGELGRRIKAARAYAELSQIEMARKLGVSSGTLIRWEKGQREIEPLTRMGVALQVAELTNYPVREFLTEAAAMEVSDAA